MIVYFSMERASLAQNQPRDNLESKYYMHTGSEVNGSLFTWKSVFKNSHVPKDSNTKFLQLYMYNNLNDLTSLMNELFPFCIEVKISEMFFCAYSLHRNQWAS